MVYEANLIGKLKDSREIYEVCASLDKQIPAFERAGIKHPFLASPDEVALIRLDKLSNDWSRTCMAPVKVKGKPTILTAISPFMNPIMAAIAVDFHKKNQYPTLPEISYELLETEAKAQSSLTPEDRTTHILEGKADSGGKFYLTPEMDDSRFILKKHVQRYFGQFKHSQIPFFDLPDDASKGQAFVNYLWFSGPRDGSGLSARYRGLGDGLRAFGVRGKTSKAGSQNSGYNLTNIRNASDEAIKQTLGEMNITGMLGFGLQKRNTGNLLEILRKKQ